MFRRRQTCWNWGDADATRSTERLGPFLGFSPDVARRYEVESRDARVRHLRAAILMGVVSYNSYDALTYITMPDVAGEAVVLRLVVTALAALVYLALPRLSGIHRECLILGAMIAASAVPLYLFWATRAVNSPLSFVDFLLTIVFGVVVLQVRFPAAIALTAFCWVCGELVVMFRPELSTEMRLGLSMQLLLATIFLLLSSRLMQKSHREAYLANLRETTRSSELEIARQSFAALSMTDALTGLGNRRCLDEVLPEWLVQARAGRMRFAFILVDVDYFKAYNDRYGHLAGDACLREIGGALAGVAREDRDLVLRYGGEEFAILMRGVGERVALERANDFLAAVASLAIDHVARPDRVGRVTISAGLTHVETGVGRSVDAVIAEADAALYRAKRSGRARILTAHPGPMPDQAVPA